MEPECSSPHLKETATSPYPEPDRANLCPSTNLSTIYFNIILPSTPGPSGFPTKILYASLFPPVHLSIFYLFLQFLIIGELKEFLRFYMPLLRTDTSDCTSVDRKCCFCCVRTRLFSRYALSQFTHFYEDFMAWEFVTLH
jgi:hypothetical protein